MRDFSLANVGGWLKTDFGRHPGMAREPDRRRTFGGSSRSATWRSASGLRPDHQRVDRVRLLFLSGTEDGSPRGSPDATFLNRTCAPPNRCWEESYLLC